jgi:alpha-beta hydrolase superfamily lysophospholipase
MVDDYAADPLCGKLCSAGFYRDLTGGLRAIHRKEALARIDRKLPVYIFCGSADPVGEMGASPTKLVNAYRARGMEDLEFVLYPEARHEPLNETNREEVIEALLNWLTRHLSD